MYDLKALYEAQSVQDAVRLRLEHPQAPTCWSRCGRESGPGRSSSRFTASTR